MPALNYKSIADPQTRAQLFEIYVEKELKDIKDSLKTDSTRIEDTEVDINALTRKVILLENSLNTLAKSVNLIESIVINKDGSPATTTVPEQTPSSTSVPSVWERPSNKKSVWDWFR